MKPSLSPSEENPVSMETLYDRDDRRSAHCFPSEIYTGRSANNPYQSLKNRSCYPKTPVRVPRLDAYDYKKLSINDDEKSFGFNNLRRKSLSSCDLFHMTSKTLSSPFDEIHNWLNNKRKGYSRKWLKETIIWKFRYYREQSRKDDQWRIRTDSTRTRTSHCFQPTISLRHSLFPRAMREEYSFLSD